jgi:UDP-N-acetylglucosamine--N-acetylmuramyl-(pentapeptide) pyrophosphoryl-undecaprenol N-acetylglucosamine transferase
MPSAPQKPYVAIACGGTGGHLFPGMAVGQALLQRGCAVGLMVSGKDVDQRAVAGASGFEVQTLPAVALTRGGVAAFARGFISSHRQARKHFSERRPSAVLAMGGFTSAPPIIAGWRAGAATFFHESNTIPGRANRWLVHFVDEAFVGFESATGHLFLQRVTTTGTPVRGEFQPMDQKAARVMLGLSPEADVLLITGGSQGARGINDLVLAALPALAARFPRLQFIHLTGGEDVDRVRAGYDALKLRAGVLPFLSEMELALGAATLVISRAGASSLAEMAAMAVPAVLIPYPSAADNHQWHNARHFELAGAARLLDQHLATGPDLAEVAGGLLEDPVARAKMSTAFSSLHVPDAAGKIACRMLEVMGRQGLPAHPGRTSNPSHSGAASDPALCRFEPVSEGGQ